MKKVLDKKFGNLNNIWFVPKQFGMKMRFPCQVETKNNWPDVCPHISQQLQLSHLEVFYQQAAINK